MPAPTETLAAFAALLDYPGQVTLAEIEQLARTIQAAVPDARADLDSFVAFVRAYSPPELEEIYTSTFDGNAECALEVGWHLYGEAYQRGVFLVQMRDRLRRLGIEESTELPDHLTHVLRALARLDGAEHDRLARIAVMPAVAKMRDGLQARSSAYQALLQALLVTLEQATSVSVGGSS
ncbi:MAG: nitrate reductase molybdenum cofactor assembly chaperone [Planctomycetota bacterium]